MEEIVSKNSEGDERSDKVIYLPQNEFLVQRLRSNLEETRQELNLGKNEDGSNIDPYEGKHEALYKIVILEALLKDGSMTKSEAYTSVRQFAIMDKVALESAFVTIKRYCETGDRNDMV